MGVFHEEGAYRAKIGNASLEEAKNEKKTLQVILELELLASIGATARSTNPRPAASRPKSTWR